MMMNSQHLRVIESTNPLSIIPKPSLIINGNISLLPIYRKRYNIPKKYGNSCIRASSGKVRAVSSRVTEKEEEIKITEKQINVKAVVTVQVTSGDLLDLFTLTFPLDVLSDLFGRTLLLELVSTDLDSGTGREKETMKGYARKVWSKIDGEINYECDFTVPAGFGEVGAVLVENELHTELFLKNIVLDGFPNGPVNVSCDSFVHSKFDNPTKRIFFTNKYSYLPSNTPSGLKRLREEELENLRGNGQGERKTFERIYDYDTYNDLGNPESDEDLRRPVLGGKEHPYPRRCRTGRPHYKNEKDKDSEQRSSSVYVPRDEEFADTKQASFGANLFKSAFPSLIPQIKNLIEDPRLGFPYFTAIDTLFDEDETVKLPKFKKAGIVQSVLRWLIGIVKAVADLADLFQFETPELLDRDKFAWMRDEEFARQMLAGLNPYCIELVTEWPLKSKLDPEIYGSPESLITTELVEKEIRGIMTVEEALNQKRLFLLDYHDLYLPYVHKVRSIEGTTLYGSRTLLFLDDSTLRLIAIELTRPPIDDKPQWKQVFTPSYDATDCWLWRLAKAHVCAHDAGFHQLVTHWLRTHCCAETYVIAAHRQLSAVHPIYRLLHPHFRYTMEINARARESLVNAGGIIESTFSPGKYSMELSSVAYDKLWRFDMEALPADLIRRGMAVEDPTAKHGLKLTIEDYPFANDGLDLWDAIKQWVTDYVNHCYPNPALVESDSELQAWWKEVRTKAHEDKKDEPWWPVLKTPEDLIKVLTTIIWVSSAHHAAVNFGQYLFGGYFPNRPTITRINMPTEDPKENDFNNFLKKPDLTMLQTFPSQIQATTVVTVLGVLSSHSEDEEYIGKEAEPSWKENPIINAAYERFYGRLKVLEGTIDERNTNLKLRNRTGAGVVPYELLKPFSPPGVTGKGVPNSISI